MIFFNQPSFYLYACVNTYRIIRTGKMPIKLFLMESKVGFCDGEKLVFEITSKKCNMAHANINLIISVISWLTADDEE